MLLQTGLEIHRDNAPDNLLPFQAHMDQRYNEMKAHIEQHYGIKVGGQKIRKRQQIFFKL